MPNLPPFLIRISAFIRKEIFEIIRQPLLILTLVLGPFLILFFFGIGFRNEPRALRTMFVTQTDEGLSQRIEQYASSLGTQLIFSGITTDLAVAQAKLQTGEIDLITVIPPKPYQTILNNQQVVLELYHREIDPFQTDYVNVFGRVYVDEINRRVLRLITTTGQTDVSQIQATLVIAQTSLANLREALTECAEILAEAGQGEQCDRQTVREYVQELDDQVDQVDQALEENTKLNEAIQNALAEEEESGPDPDTLSLRDEMVEHTQELTDLSETVEDYLAQLQQLDDLDSELELIRARLNEFLDIDPRVLISPFRSQTQSIAEIVPSIADYFAPAVIVLLLQHLAVTFAALSMVREHQLGTMELFFVSPLSPLEVLLGKYLSYLIFGGVLALVLFLLITFGLGALVLGSWLDIALVIAALLFTSIGVGFVFSLLSQTDIQAVQYSMIVLLTSVFFSGFMLSLEALWQPVRAISWSLPATYGIVLLRDIMLRGSPLSAPTILQLLLMSIAIFVAAWVLLRRTMVHG
jgi:ABC-2 type transport system permease protein